jgi:hypothetical protein
MNELLAERVEQATGPDRDLDRDIAAVILSYDRADTLLPLYTASLDAAMTLVPEGWEEIRQEQVRMTDGTVRCWASVGSVDAAMTKRCATPALALCAAALRARTTGGQ